jgi:hypothetical protein
VVAATTDPATLPGLSTGYLATNLPRPGAPRADEAPFGPADLAEVVRLYGRRNGVEQGYKQVKQELGSADFMVRSDRAIRRHWHLVCCAFSFCWQAWFAAPEPPAHQAAPAAEADASSSEARAATPTPGRGGKMGPERAPGPGRLASWPVALRRVRGWLDPWTFLRRCWRAWSNAPPPPELQALLDAVCQGRPLNLHLPP